MGSRTYDTKAAKRRRASAEREKKKVCESFAAECGQTFLEKMGGHPPPHGSVTCSRTTPTGIMVKFGIVPMGRRW